MFTVTRGFLNSSGIGLLVTAGYTIGQTFELVNGRATITQDVTGSVSLS